MLSRLPPRSSLDEFARMKLDELAAKHLRRALVETTPIDAVAVERDGRRLVSFSSNDYLNFTQHPAIKAAAIAATEKFGVGAGASRLVTGNHPLYEELESRLARLKGTEAACVFGSGYLANAGIIPALIGAEDLLLVDELAHACLWTGAQLTRGTVRTFRHNNLADAEWLLAEHRADHPRAMILTDGVFSMDGDCAPLAALADLAQRYNAWLMSDDAHGLGVIGDGRGSAFAAGLTSNALPLQMGTLSKAIGGYGGYVCASRPVIDLIKTRARTLIYSTALPPAVVAAALAALDFIETDRAYTALPLEKAKSFTRRAGLSDATSPIVPVIIGEAEATLAASRMLEDEGFLVVAIRPPTVPSETARLRLSFTAAHRDDDIARLADLIRTRLLAR
jgi:8-amino-7-oxononanoate synthase